MIVIREISKHDMRPFFHLMAEIECGAHFDPDNPEHVSWLEDRIHKRFSAGARFYALYESEDVPVGIASLLIERTLHSDWSNAELVDIGVFAQYRGKGYGSQLLRFIETKAKQENSYCLHVQTYAGAYGTIAFYGRNGYVPVATVPDTNGPGDEGTLWMRKVL